MRSYFRTIKDRLEGRREVTADGCWLYTGARTASGYGLVRTPDGLKYAHVAAWGLYCGEVPEGWQVDHLCRNRACFNPDHLEPVTARENMARTDVAWAKFNRGTCARGHDTTNLENVYHRPDGTGRMCRECQRQRRPHNRVDITELEA